MHAQAFITQLCATIWKRRIPWKSTKHTQLPSAQFSGPTPIWNSVPFLSYLFGCCLFTQALIYPPGEQQQKNLKIVIMSSQKILAMCSAYKWNPHMWKTHSQWALWNMLQDDSKYVYIKLDSLSTKPFLSGKIFWYILL